MSKIEEIDGALFAVSKHEGVDTVLLLSAEGLILGGVGAKPLGGFGAKTVELAQASSRLLGDTADEIVAANDVFRVALVRAPRRAWLLCRFGPSADAGVVIAALRNAADTLAL